MKSIYLLSFILVLASAKLAVDISSYQFPPTGLFPCLVSQQTLTTILEILDDKGTINKYFLVPWVDSKRAKIKNIDAIIRVNDAFSPEDVANLVANGLPEKFYGIVWLDVSNVQGRWSLDISERIPYLENFVKALQDHGLKTGIFSSLDDWTAVMGSQGAGSDILSAVPVWYSHEGTFGSFYDFRTHGFGTWEKPKMKKYKSNTNLCDGFFVSSLSYYHN